MAVLLAGICWDGAAPAGETRTIIEMDTSRDRVVTGRDFLLLPVSEQVALVWGITVGQKQGVQRIIGVLFHMRNRFSSDFLDELTRAAHAFPHGCDCTAKDGCKSIESRRAIRDLVVDYMNDDDLRKDQNLEHIVDYALTDYCR